MEKADKFLLSYKPNKIGELFLERRTPFSTESYYNLMADWTIGFSAQEFWEEKRARTHGDQSGKRSISQTSVCGFAETV